MTENIEAATSVLDPLVAQPLNPYTYKLIYCYTVPGSSSHEGLCKIGKTNFSTNRPFGSLSQDEIDDLVSVAADNRIKQQRGTISVKTQTHWVESVAGLAVSKSSSEPDNVFRRWLELKGYKQGRPNGSEGTEWMYISPEEAHEKFQEFSAEMSSKDDALKLSSEYPAVVLRKEQQHFVDNTTEAWEKGREERLWFAKMRFGKTITAYSFLKNILQKENAPKRMLVLTHRPVVNDGWHKDFQKVMQGTNWEYSSKELSDAKKYGNSRTKTLKELEKNNTPYTYFVSMQDLRGKDKMYNSFKQTNKDIFDTPWDIVIIDEAHEGNSTELAEQVHEGLNRKFTLYLSGTPYKLVGGERFPQEDIDTWDYTDEQEAKELWDTNHPHLDNPYAVLPQMWINTLDIRKKLKEEIQEEFITENEDSAFDFNKFFETKDGKTFTNEKHILGFLKQIKGPESNKGFMPFSPQRQHLLNHTLWALPSVKACKAMEALLNQHEFYSKYTILNVSGDDEAESKAHLNKVEKAISDKPNETKTITLTVGRLTTGVSIPAWVGVLMLRNTNSPELYMQTIFRVQTPHELDGARKEHCYVWDFAPDRVLKVFTEANDISTKAGGATSNDGRFSEANKRSLNKLLKYLPIISRTTSEDLRFDDAGKILRQLKRIYAERVTRSGFDTNLLFIKDLGVLTPEIREAIEEIRQTSGSSTSTSNKLDKNITIAANGMLGGKDKTTPPTDEELEAQRKELIQSLKEPALTEEDKTVLKEQKEAVNKEQQERSQIRNVLKTISVRIPYMVMALMSDQHFKRNKLEDNFTMKEFADAIDDESWKEFFGTITKETFKMLEPAFDAEVLQVSVKDWIDQTEKAVNLRNTDVDEYIKSIRELMLKVKNPNKETVLTPFGVVEMVYHAAGFTNDKTGQKKWAETLKMKERQHVDGNHEKRHRSFYDINVKTGFFPLYAAWQLSKAAQNKYGDKAYSWDKICDELIYANSRTLAAKWVTCTLLGKPREWDHITVIDVIKELEQDDIKENYKYFQVGYKLTKQWQSKGKQLTDEQLLERIEQTEVKVKEYSKTLNEKVKAGDMTRQEKEEAVNTKRSELTQELADNITDFKFDYTISNPPYQIVMNTATGKAFPIWQEFIWVANSNSRNMAFINPARWLKGGQGTGLLPVKNWLLSNPHLKEFITMPGGEVFPSAGIAGGVSIEIINNGEEYDNPLRGEWSPASQKWIQKLAPYIRTEGIDISLNPADEVLISKILVANIGPSVERKLWVGGQDNSVKAKSKHSEYDSNRDYTLMGPRLIRDTHYFILEEEKQAGLDYVKIWYNDRSPKARFLPRDEFVDNDINNSRIPTWKALVPKTNAHFIYRNLGPIGEPSSLSTNTWNCISFDSEEEVKSYYSYLKTYFYRYLISTRTVSHNALANAHRFIPDLVDIVNPRTGKKGYESDWTDDDLRIIFKDVLTDDDWRYIKKKAVEADGGKGDYEAGWKFPDGSKHSSLVLKEDVDE